MLTDARVCLYVAMFTLRGFLVEATFLCHLDEPLLLLSIVHFVEPVAQRVRKAGKCPFLLSLLTPPFHFLSPV